MTENPERPLVTLALLAYNQEAYVGAAIAGAFAQTYQPLEIILSDDCSTDRTYEIMEEMARSYSGPHQIILRERTPNLGLSRHVNTILGMARGEIMVLAAGDDICEPARVERLVDVFSADPAAMLVHSDAFEIDTAGTLGPVQRPLFPSDNPDPRELMLEGHMFIGATGSLRRDLLTTFGPITEQHAFEDLVLGFRASLLGGVRYLPEPLVRYRVGIGISSMGARQTSFARMRHRHAEIMLATLRQREADLARIEHPAKPQMLAALRARQSELARIKAFHEPAPGGAPDDWRSYPGKLARHGWFGVVELLRHLKFEITRRRR